MTADELSARMSEARMILAAIELRAEFSDYDYERMTKNALLELASSIRGRINLYETFYNKRADAAKRLVTWASSTTNEGREQDGMDKQHETERQ